MSKHQKQVDFMYGLYQSWLLNLQRDAYAHGTIISPEVIRDAFDQLREHYDILSNIPDVNEVIQRIFEEEDK